MDRIRGPPLARVHGPSCEPSLWTTSWTAYRTTSWTTLLFRSVGSHENFGQICIFEYANHCELICFGQKKPENIFFLPLKSLSLHKTMSGPWYRVKFVDDVTDCVHSDSVGYFTRERRKCHENGDYFELNGICLLFFEKILSCILTKLIHQKSEKSVMRKNETAYYTTRFALIGHNFTAPATKSSVRF